MSMLRNAKLPIIKKVLAYIAQFTHDTYHTGLVFINANCITVFINKIKKINILVQLTFYLSVFI